jgi:predicted Fe-S protein YdhL (DUF1289 family)
MTGEADGAIASPCINVCKMEEGLCIGCLRTLEEIAGWASAGDDDRRAILAAVAQRRTGPGPA